MVKSKKFLAKLLRICEKTNNTSCWALSTAKISPGIRKKRFLSSQPNWLIPLGTISRKAFEFPMLLLRNTPFYQPSELHQKCDPIGFLLPFSIALILEILQHSLFFANLISSINLSPKIVGNTEFLAKTTLRKLIGRYHPNCKIKKH